MLITELPTMITSFIYSFTFFFMLFLMLLLRANSFYWSLCYEMRCRDQCHIVCDLSIKGIPLCSICIDLTCLSIIIAVFIRCRHSSSKLMLKSKVNSSFLVVGVEPTLGVVISLKAGCELLSHFVNFTVNWYLLHQ